MKTDSDVSPNRFFSVIMMGKTASLGLLFLPVAGIWVAWHERKILREGVPLSSQGMMDAAEVGVRHPEKIRVLQVRNIPVLNGRFIRALSKFWPEISTHTIGLCLRYGIYLRKGTASGRERELIAHECAHTAQYEACGGILRFLLRYFSECIHYGYLSAPMEMEAVERTERINPSGN